MTISLLLLPYAAIVLLFLLASLVFVYHLLRFGIASFSLAAVLIIYVLVSGALLTSSFKNLADIDWTTPLQFDQSRATSQFFLPQ